MHSSVSGRGRVASVELVKRSIHHVHQPFAIRASPAKLRRIHISGRRDSPGTHSVSAQLMELAVGPRNGVLVSLGRLHGSWRPNHHLRKVSVRFLDIVGSTQIIQLLDRKELQAMVDGALTTFTAIVEPHGGQVLR